MPLYSMPTTNLHRFLCVAAGLLLGFSSPAVGGKSPYEWAFIGLDFARDEKYEQLDRLCRSLQGKASGITADTMMLDFFAMALKVRDLDRSAEVLPEAAALRQQLDQQFNTFVTLLRKRYLAEYISFYDLLFVSTDGDVVYTLRKEKDDQTNLFTGQDKDSPLARQLQQTERREAFVDFFDDAASGKPSAFFIEPAVRDGQQLGWFVLQVTLNKFNSLFSGHEQLNSTGETFLVNRDGYLLTESSFVGDATILKMKLDDRNITSKFAAARGHKTVVDYRGFCVLSSFATYRLMDTDWLIVAKVDEDEVLTRYFMDHFNYFFNRLPERLSAGSPQKTEPVFANPGRHCIMVDMDEFVKAAPGERLETVGVSTCTALVVAFPGKFGYLAHISPYDQMYGRDRTNLLGNLLKKTMYYDVYPFERRQIRMTVIASHLQSLRAILEKLTAEGLLLSQIGVLYEPAAKSANVTYDPGRDVLCVEWNRGDTPAGLCTVGLDNNLQTIFKTLIDLPAGPPEGL